VTDDGTLARRWGRGDGAAGAELAGRHAQAMGAAAYAKTGDVHLADDAVQEAFARASRSIGQLRDERRVAAWLVTLARNAASDMMRRRRRERPLDKADPAGNGNPASDAMADEIGESIRKAVDGLSDDQRAVFMMRYVAQMRYDEIAMATGISRDAVAQKLHRIRKKLQTKLEAFRP